MHVEKGAKAVHYESGPDMTPLVDVVMVLLIFLMMVGKFGGSKKYLVSDAPITDAKGTAQAEVDPTKVPQENITLSVSSGAGARDQFMALYAAKIKATDADTLSSQLKAMLEEKVAQGRKVDDIQVFIKPTRNVIYSNIVQVYSATLKAGFTKIGFQTSDG